MTSLRFEFWYFSESSVCNNTSSWVPIKLLPTCTLFNTPSFDDKASAFSRSSGLLQQRLVLNASSPGLNHYIGDIHHRFLDTNSKTQCRISPFFEDSSLHPIEYAEGQKALLCPCGRTTIISVHCTSFGKWFSRQKHTMARGAKLAPNSNILQGKNVLIIDTDWEHYLGEDQPALVRGRFFSSDLMQGYLLRT